MRIDLHVHTSDRSDCGNSTEEEMIHAAVACGLDAVALSDHGRLPPPGHLAVLNERHAPFRIFPGIEIAIGDEHIVVIGLEESELEREDWTYGDLHKFVADRGGFLFIAHPFRYHETLELDIERFPPGAVEINSANMGLVDEAKLARLTGETGLVGLCNSDAHIAQMVGIYHNVLARTATDSRELVALLTEGAYRCVRMEERIAAANVLGIKPLR